MYSRLVTGPGSLRVFLPPLFISYSVKRSLKLTARLSAMAVRKILSYPRAGAGPRRGSANDNLYLLVSALGISHPHWFHHVASQWRDYKLWRNAARCPSSSSGILLRWRWSAGGGRGCWRQARQPVRQPVRRCQRLVTHRGSPSCCRWLTSESELGATEVTEDVCHLRLRVTPVSSICVLSCCYGKVIQATPGILPIMPV